MQHFLDEEVLSQLLKQRFFVTRFGKNSYPIRNPKTSEDTVCLSFSASIRKKSEDLNSYLRDLLRHPTFACARLRHQSLASTLLIFCLDISCSPWHRSVFYRRRSLEDVNPSKTSIPRRRPSLEDIDPSTSTIAYRLLLSTLPTLFILSRSGALEEVDRSLESEVSAVL